MSLGPDSFNDRRQTPRKLRRVLCGGLSQGHTLASLPERSGAIWVAQLHAARLCGPVRSLPGTLKRGKFIGGDGNGAFWMKHRFELDFSGVEALLLPEPEPGAPTPDDEVPVARRGVKIDWLFDFLRAVGNAYEDIWQRYNDHERAYTHLNPYGYIPEAEPPDVERHPELTGYFLQRNIVKRLTARCQASLYTRIPPEARGDAKVFVSHAWSDPLGILPDTTLTDMVSGNNPVSRADPCWIDLFVYNQHSPQDIANDMERIIGEIGTLVLPLPSPAAVERLWCIWEWLSAHRAGAHIILPEAAYSLYYFGKKREWFESEFRSVAKAKTTLATDRDQIMAAILDVFGTVEAADAEIRRLADRFFSRAEEAPYRRGTN